MVYLNILRARAYIRVLRNGRLMFTTRPRALFFDAEKATGPTAVMTANPPLPVTSYLRVLARELRGEGWPGAESRGPGTKTNCTRSPDAFNAATASSCVTLSRSTSPSWKKHSSYKGLWSVLFWGFRIGKNTFRNPHNSYFLKQISSLRHCVLLR